MCGLQVSKRKALVLIAGFDWDSQSTQPFMKKFNNCKLWNKILFLHISYSYSDTDTIVSTCDSFPSKHDYSSSAGFCTPFQINELNIIRCYYFSPLWRTFMSDLKVNDSHSSPVSINTLFFILPLPQTHSQAWLPLGKRQYFSQEWLPEDEPFGENEKERPGIRCWVKESEQPVMW